MGTTEIRKYKKGWEWGMLKKHSEDIYNTDETKYSI